VRWKVETERQGESVDLLIWRFSCIVLVLVIWICLQTLGYWEQAARIQPGGRPFGVRAFVQEFGVDIWARMIGVNRNSALDRNSITLSSLVTAIRPIEIGAVLVRNQ
jgi:hypothetical protein